MAFRYNTKLCLGSKHVLTFGELYEQSKEKNYLTCLSVKDSHLVIQDIVSVRESESEVIVILTYDDGSQDQVTADQQFTHLKKGVVRADELEKFDQIKSAIKRSDNKRFFKVVRGILKFHEKVKVYEVVTKDCDNLVTVSGAIMKINQ